MIITDTTLVGYSVINGTWSIQLGLLVGSLVNLTMFPNSMLKIPQNPLFHRDLQDIMGKMRI
jgi:hypothetical protein